MRNEEKKKLAHSRFINSHMTRKEIAESVGCTPKTLRGWIKDGNWENQKESRTITRGELLQDAYRQLKAINKKINDELGGVPNKELSDAKGVIRKEIESLTSNPLHIYVDVNLELLEWIRKNKPEKLTDFVNCTNEFINEIAKEKGI